MRCVPLFAGDGMSGVPFVDNWADAELGERRFWSVDKLHLNARGHTRVATHVLQSLSVPVPEDWGAGTSAAAEPGADAASSTTQVLSHEAARTHEGRAEAPRGLRYSASMGRRRVLDAVPAEDGPEQEHDDRDDREHDSHPEKELQRLDHPAGDQKHDSNHGDDDEQEGHDVTSLLAVMFPVWSRAYPP